MTNDYENDDTVFEENPQPTSKPRSSLVKTALKAVLIGLTVGLAAVGLLLLGGMI